MQTFLMFAPVETDVRVNGNCVLVLGQIGAVVVVTAAVVVGAIVVVAAAVVVAARVADRFY